MSEQVSVVAVLPDGKEHFENIRPFGGRRREGLTSRDYDKVASNAVRAAGIKTTRSDPQTVRVQLYRLVIDKGELKRVHIGKVDVQPPLMRMTDAEFNAEMTTLLASLPEEFRDWVSCTSYEDGHSSGYEECINIAEQMVSGLQPCIEKYTKRLTEQPRQNA